MEKAKETEGIISYVKGSLLRRRIFAAILSFAFVYAVPSMFAVKGDKLFYTNSIGAFLLWLFVFGSVNYILRFSFPPGNKKWILPGVFALLFCICMVFGADLEVYGSIDYTDSSMWSEVIALLPCTTLFVRYSWEKLKEASKKETTQKIKRNFGGESTCYKKDFLIRTGIILLCYIPVFLAVYPGFFVYDAQDELMQVITRNFTTHHPLMHVLFMGGIVQLIHKLSGSYNLGIACYTVIQMTILAFIFSFVIGLLQKKGMKRSGCLAISLYFGLCPVIVMFSLCSAKDGLFMGMVLLQVMMLREMLDNAEAFWGNKMQIGLFAVSSLGMMLLRHNGLYAFGVFAVFILVFGKKLGLKKYGKRIAVCFIGILVCYLLLNRSVSYIFHAKDAGNQELLTVPIQQMTRVHEMQNEALSEEEKAVLYEILSPDVMARYTPKLSDGVKYFFNNEAYNTNPAKYLKLWLKLGVKNPFTYLNAWFMTSYGFWYPDAVIDVYRGNRVFTFTYEDSSYFGYEVEQPGERESKIPVLDELYRKLSLEITQQKIPVISMLFSPGFLFWIFAYVLCFMWYMGKKEKAVPYLLPGLIWLTFLLGPTYLVRYVVYLWCLLPVLLYDVCLIIGNNCDILTKANCEEE